MDSDTAQLEIGHGIGYSYSKNAMKITVLLLVTHICAAAIGFALGIYTLPILTAEPSPSSETIVSAKRNMLYSGFFTPDSVGSDMLHWGDGSLSARTAEPHVSA